MKVVWDNKKGAANIRNHGIEFSHAATVLDDPMAITIEDTRHTEQRFITIGSDLLGRVLVVVYSYSGEEEIRLISARKATPRERRIYEQKE
ncbi:MAG: BrnT family toxin [Deltaproteobacteria bacterium]|nr:BrnT family toxin [Deltaproteobacteria bacterium]